MLSPILALPIILTLTVCFAGAAPQAPAGRTSGFTVTGQILTDATRDEGRRPVSLEINRQRIETVYTDTAGRFEFRNLPAANYEVVVDLEGYESERQRVDFPPNFNSAVVLIPLRRKVPPPDADVSGGVVQAAELNIPRNAREEFEKAEEEIRKGNSDKAVTRLQTAIKIAPDFFRAHIALGLAYKNLKRYRDAEHEFKLSRTLNPRASQPLLELVNLYIEEADAESQQNPGAVMKILDQALKNAQEALALEPGSAMANYLFGIASYRSMLPEQAETHLRRALEIDPRIGAARLMLANLYARIGNLAAARDQLDAYLAEHPTAANRRQIEQARDKLDAALIPPR